MGRNSALDAEDRYKSDVEKTAEYVEFFDILETITNVGNDEVFTPRKIVDVMLDSLPEEVWHNPDYKWLNPATKTGIFEREIAIRLDEGLKNIIPDVEKRRKHILQDMIFSIGQTKFTANVARRTLYYCCQANRKCDGIVENGHYVNGYAIGNGTWFDDAEGNVKTPCTDHVIRKGKCIYCGISDKSKYLDANQREKYSYDFIHCDPGDDLQTFLANRFFKGDKNVKFDVIVGNPPYHLNDGGNGASATPIYQKFVNQAISLNPKYVSMIIPARWYSGGKGLDDFRKEIINDTRIQKLTDHPISKECFSSGIEEIKGGVCYFLWNRDYNGKCTVTTIVGDNTSVAIRPLKEKGSDTFIRFNKAISIFHKVVSDDFVSFKKYVSSRKPFGFQTNFRGHLNFEEGDCKIYVRDDCQFVSRKEVTVNLDWVDKYKIYISKAYGAGEKYPHQIINVPINGEYGSCCNETYLVIGPFDSEDVVKNVISYIKTKFFRFMVLLMKITQDATQDVYSYVPDQDFSIQWNDEMLYTKYKLDQDEIEYIESMIREMV